MKVELIYHEIKRKEFRSKKTLNKFLRSKLPSEILRAIEVKKGIWYMLEIEKFIRENRQ
jgi:hypothetical protein